MSEEFERGQREGLRLALAILSMEEAKWEALLGESRSRRTNAAREVRYNSFRTAQSRVRTALNRMQRRKSSDLDAELASTLAKLAL